MKQTQPEKTEGSERARCKRDRAKKVLLVIAGIISLILGIVGVFLPLLPTTPFILLAGACFVRSSNALYQRLLRNRWSGPMLRDWEKHHGIKRSTKIKAIALMTLMLGTSTVLFVPVWQGKVAMTLVGIGVVILILKLKEVPETRVEDL